MLTCSTKLIEQLLQQNYHFQLLKNLSWFHPLEEAADPPPAQLAVHRMPPAARKPLEKSLWTLCIARNAFVVVISALVAYAFDPDLPEGRSRDTTFVLTGRIKPGLPEWKVPDFVHDGLTFTEMVKELGSAVVIIPLVAILENVAIAKAFGKIIDWNCSSEGFSKLGPFSICPFLSESREW